jgi:2-polyprenyl-3-methyl-5-hydroxy-6-metoxy-1,4-benzoquinol methylase
MATCILCQSDIDQCHIFDFGDIPFYYGVQNQTIESILKNRALNAFLITCPTCGLTQQVRHEKNNEILERVYRSQNADASTPMDEEGWGKARVEAFFRNTDFLFAPSNVLEVGCQNGYLLYELSKRSTRTLLGVEPGRHIPFEKDGFKAEIINEFFHINLLAGRKFDTIICLWVLEHISNPVTFLNELCEALTDDGQLILSVPNAAFQMRMGDPGLFMHEHISHFTSASIKNMLNVAGLEPIRIRDSLCDLYVVARKFTRTKSERAFTNYVAEATTTAYKKSLELVLDRFAEWVHNTKHPGLWGACATASNLLRMVEVENYVVFDGDPLKQGQIISGLKGYVQKPTADNIKSLSDSICVVPVGFQHTIGSILENYGVSHFQLFG